MVVSNLEPLLYSLPETAEMLGISLNRLRKTIEMRELPTLRIGARVLVSRNALEKFLEERSV
jgi:excisionase family DNA binding protein